MPKIESRTVALVLLYALFAFALVAFVKVVAFGASTVQLFELSLAWTSFDGAIRLDSISTLILLMVSFLGVVIGQYSVRYLNGELRQNYFFRFLTFTIFSVALFVTAANLIVLFAAWLATSFGLHKLLLFYPERRNAVRAARKKFLVSRLGDVFLLAGIWLAYLALRTFEFQEMFRLVQGTLTQHQSLLLSWSGIFVVCGAMTKSAQFPFHFWLPETMETPTPVSALMHAGIINGGGFLIIRLSPLIAHASFASLSLAVCGAVTGVYASLVMVTQNDIKRKLAYSTIGQMGLMMFACGIGAYTFALFHIVAHSLYKAHAFLSTGDLVDEAKKVSQKIFPQSLIRILFFAALGIALILLSLIWNRGQHVAEVTYVSVLILGLSQNHDNRVTGNAWILFVTVLLMAAGGLGYAFLESLVRIFTVSEIVSFHLTAGFDFPLLIICLVSYLIFVAGFYLSNGIIQPTTSFQKRLYVYFWNGGYFAILSDRLIRRQA